jgi:hypothetical protein
MVLNIKKFKWKIAKNRKLKADFALILFIIFIISIIIKVKNNRFTLKITIALSITWSQIPKNSLLI